MPDDTPKTEAPKKARSYPKQRLIDEAYDRFGVSSHHAASVLYEAGDTLTLDQARKLIEKAA